MATADTATGSWKQKLWMGLAALLLITWGALLYLFFAGGENETLSALNNGQRIHINTKTGEISGNMASTLPEELPATNDEQEPEPQTKPGFEVGPPDGAETSMPEAEGTPESEGTPSADMPKDATAKASAATADAPSKAKATPPAPTPKERFARGKDSLNEPKAELMQKTEQGMIPAIGSDGTKPRDYYAHRFDYTDKPIVAILLTHAGLNVAATASALELPPEISLAFSPYKERSRQWTEYARNVGHESWVQLPAEPEDYPASDPGPQGLLNERSIADNLVRLQWNLAQFPAYVGGVLLPDEHFSESRQNIQALAESFRRYGLALIISNAASGQREQSAYRDTVMATTDILDAELNRVALETALNELVARAKRDGYALGIARATPLMVQSIEAFLENNQLDGAVLAPASAILSKRN